MKSATSQYQSSTSSSSFSRSQQQQQQQHQQLCDSLSSILYPPISSSLFQDENNSNGLNSIESMMIDFDDDLFLYHVLEQAVEISNQTSRIIAALPPSSFSVSSATSISEEDEGEDNDQDMDPTRAPPPPQ